MQRSPIEWTDYTSNPVKFRDAEGRVVWGCVHASEGCAHCYAEALAHRYGRGGPFTAPVMAGLTPFVDEAELRSILRSKAPAGSRCFLGDMTDVFAPWVTDEMLDRVFAVMALRPDLDFQVLTKRPERMRAYLSADGRYDAIIDTSQVLDDWLPGNKAAHDRDGFVIFAADWPLPNVWLGTSVENQHWADVRIPELLATPAAVRFISAEPLLGPIDIAAAYPELGASTTFGFTDGFGYEALLHWVIVGGESGPGARPCDLAWIHSIVQQCQAAGVACFFKQGGSSNRCSHDRKGGHFECFPADLKIREFPHANM